MPPARGRQVFKIGNVQSKMSAPKTFVFRVCYEVEYTAEEIKAEFDKFANTSVEEIAKQLKDLMNKNGFIEIDGDGYGCNDTVNDFIEYAIDEADEDEKKDAEKAEECEESEEEADCLF